jgi:hypothetical protein
MAKFQDSTWALDLDSEVDLPQVSRAPARTSQNAATPADKKRQKDRLQSLGWFDSTMDLQRGAEVAELTELPPEFLDALGGGQRTGQAD